MSEGKEQKAVISSPELVIIAAVSDNGIIGVHPPHPLAYGGKPHLPWRIPEDMAHFKHLTTGYPVIMGRVTYETLPWPLVNRKNIVVSSKDFPGVSNARSIHEALWRHAYSDENGCRYSRVFLMGGEAIFREGLSYADRLELTQVHVNIQPEEYTTRFPTIENIVDHKEKPVWIKSKEQHVSGTIPHSFTTYVRAKRMPV